MTKKILIGLAIVLMPIWLQFAARPFGFYVDTPGWRVAKELVENGKSVDECSKIFFMPWQIFSTPTFDQRQDCVYEYAEATVDPTVCERLLPHEYGIACIGNTWPDISRGVICAIDEKDHSIFFCRNDDGTFRRSKNCEDFQDVREKSVCISAFAQRDKKLEQCNKITDEQIRIFCETKLGAWEKYPELRNSTWFGTIKPLE